MSYHITPNEAYNLDIATVDNSERRLPRMNLLREEKVPNNSFNLPHLDTLLKLGLLVSLLGILLRK